MSRAPVVRDRAALIEVVEGWRREGKRVVLSNGAFDLFHVGHLRSLEGARACGDALVVAVNSDASVRRLKGEGRPFVPEAERAEIVAALRCTDVVTVFDEEGVAPLLLELRPHVHAKGTDYGGEAYPAAERRALERAGIELRLVGDAKAHSTSEIAREIARRVGPVA